MKTILLSIALLTLVSCEHKPVSSTSTTNPDGMQVELMFHLDSTFKPGVYRFCDGGNNKYFVISPYGDASTSSTESHGKTSTTEEIITQ
jgi:hypothetical protein